MRRRDGELLLYWALPAVLAVWLSAFLLFPGFTRPMSPAMSADAVAGFYRDHVWRIRASMIVFNWFSVGLIPVLMLIVLQIRRMGHRTPILAYCMIGCAAAGPTLFLTADLFWMIAAFRPERDAGITQLLNDLGWITFTCGVPFLIAQSVFLALAIYLDRLERPVFQPWVAHFNVVVAAALVPAAFAGLALDGAVAWNGLLSFWLKNAAIAVWIAVMWLVLGRAMRQERAAEAPAV